MEPRPSDIPFEALRRWRASVTPPGQPEWTVLSDGRLWKIAQARPRTLDELEGLHVLDAATLAEHGVAILASIQTQCTTVTEAILACVRALPGALPRSGIAKVLVGSEAERVAEYKEHPLYNLLAQHSRKEVTARVDEMLDHGLLQQDEHGHLVPQGWNHGA
jgi:ribonuclease D